MKRLAESLLQTLAYDLGIAPLEFNSEGVCRLVIESRFVIDLEWVEKQSSLFAYSVIHPHADQVTCYHGNLLASNLFGGKTHGAVFSIDSKTNEVLLHRQFEVHSDIVLSLRSELERFVETVDTWSARLLQDPVEFTSENALESDELLRV